MAVFAFTKLNVDLTWQEIILDAPAMRPVGHPYSDAGQLEGLFVRCYTLDELFAEKARAVIERSHPRDLFDLWRAVSEYRPHFDGTNMLRIFFQKCRPNGVVAAQLADRLEGSDGITYEAWETQLQRQLSAVPPLAIVLAQTCAGFIDLLPRAPSDVSLRLAIEQAAESLGAA